MMIVNALGLFVLMKLNKNWRLTLVCTVKCVYGNCLHPQVLWHFIR